MTRLAVGGMAEIYLARDPTASGARKHVVVKMLHPRLVRDPAFVRMFVDEARLAAQLHHQNIGQVYDIGEDGGRYYFTMEYLHGHDARAILEHAIVQGLRVPLEHALAIVMGVAAALHYAHDARGADGRPLDIVHRDLSPSNIFVTHDGSVKLVDFGLAKAATQSSQLRAGMVQGKAAYMSPEQCKSQPLDRRSDLFSLGTVLYELTTSRRLFRQGSADTNYAVMDRIVKGTVPRPSQVISGYPAALEAVVMRALAVDRAWRYGTAQELVRDLDTVARQERSAPSAAALARYLTDIFGASLEPWQTPGDADEGRNANEFDEEEVATTLYSGSLDDVKDAWSKERAKSSPPVDRVSRPSLRLALPLTAEDSDVFNTPMAAQLVAEPPPGELATRHEAGPTASTLPSIAAAPEPAPAEPQRAPSVEVRMDSVMEPAVATIQRSSRALWVVILVSLLALAAASVVLWRVMLP